MALQHTRPVAIQGGLGGEQVRQVCAGRAVPFHGRLRVVLQHLCVADQALHSGVGAQAGMWCALLWQHCRLAGAAG